MHDHDDCAIRAGTSGDSGAAQLEPMRTIKRTLDPKGILNPGKVLE